MISMPINYVFEFSDIHTNIYFLIHLLGMLRSTLLVGYCHLYGHITQ